MPPSYEDSNMSEVCLESVSKDDSTKKSEVRKSRHVCLVSSLKKKKKVFYVSYQLEQTDNNHIHVFADIHHLLPPSESKPQECFATGQLLNSPTFRQIFQLFTKVSYFFAKFSYFFANFTEFPY
eukprot:GHVL01040030.1.p1 GENE.GHVL01040030.1~~GHVL01040030.1.p1  ORF type:complete len:124 (-),score=0.04 GHVL01040030.1:683-1054(-)